VEDMTQQYGDLANTIVHEADEDWPTMIEIVAYFGKEGRKGRRKSITINADDFYGRTTGAPLSGAHLISMVDRLRRMK
jgi:hypothetical protein